jgi:N-methylhydantoinase A
LLPLGIPVTASHNILPEFREYERASTVLVNAYLCPRMRGYLGKLSNTFTRNGGSVQVMQSSGGIMSAQRAAEEPVRTILSGPAGGVMGAISVGRDAGQCRLLTFDMGGTSTDVSLADLHQEVATSRENRISGLPIAVPTLDIHTVGAGGGSLVWFDRGGALRVGPQSAGARPGPACYGTGDQPTVTDANLILGRLDPDHFLGGDMRLDRTRAEAVLSKAGSAFRSVEAFAEAIIGLADLHMEHALRRITIERGLNPRDYTLISFGGGGPLHACALAAGLGIGKILVPNLPGALSAYGILVSDIARDFARTVMLPWGSIKLTKYFADLERQAVAEMRRDGLANVTVQRFLDMRYRGQGY